MHWVQCIRVCPLTYLSGYFPNYLNKSTVRDRLRDLHFWR
jgi:hypothetical protein